MNYRWLKSISYPVSHMLTGKRERWGGREWCCGGGGGGGAWGGERGKGMIRSPAAYLYIISAYSLTSLH